MIMMSCEMCDNLRDEMTEKKGGTEAGKEVERKVRSEGRRKERKKGRETESFRMVRLPLPSQPPCLRLGLRGCLVIWFAVLHKDLSHTCHIHSSAAPLSSLSFFLLLPGIYRLMITIFSLFHCFPLIFHPVYYSYGLFSSFSSSFFTYIRRLVFLSPLSSLHIHTCRHILR